MTQGTSTSVSFGYDNANKRSSLTLPNGVVVSYGYDSASQMTGLTYTNGSTTLGNLIYSYDLGGRRTSMGGSLAQEELPAAISTTAYNANNQLTSWGTASLYYDANGNMTSDGTNSYVWDARNHLASMNLGGETFEYDGYGRRVGKTTITGTTNYLYDGANVVQELSGTTVTANLLSGGIDEVFMRTDSNGAANFLADALGSTIALTSSTGGTLVAYAYEPFGNTTVTSGSSANPYQYAGRENDGSGLYFNRARYYSPILQRFISEDPSGLRGGINLYSYAAGSPTMSTDPSGLWTVSLGGTININLGFTNFQYSGGFVVDGNGNIGVYNTVGGGGAFNQLGLGSSPNPLSGYPFNNISPSDNNNGSFGLTLAVSSAPNITNLSGPFINGSVGLGEGAQASADGFTGSGPDGPVVGGGITVGAGLGTSGSVTITNTTITPIFQPTPAPNPSQSNPSPTPTPSAPAGRKN